jgi:plasmid segregation protein ParM
VAEVVGLDPGNYEVKVVGRKGFDRFLSELGEYRELKLVNNFLRDDMIYEYNGVKGFAGTLAKRESEFAGSMMGTSKLHNDMLIRVLLALHRYDTEHESRFNIVVGQPIINHNHQQKEAIKKMLKGRHEFTLNGVQKVIIIENVEVAAEGASAYWSSPKKGKIRIIDAGSGTVNIATIENGMYIDKESDTLPFGLNTTISNDLDAFCRRVAIHCLKKWKRNDDVYLVGGNAEGLLVPMLYHFPNCQVLKPVVEINGQLTMLKPVFANAVAFYNIAKKVYSNVV